MKKILLAALLASTGLAAFAQKDCEFDKKTNIYACAGVQQFSFELTKSTNYFGFKDVYLLDNAGKRVAMFQYNEFPDPQAVGGRNQYYDVMFFAQQQKGEIRYYVKHSNLADLVRDEQLMKNGAIDEEAIALFIMKYDRKYSKRRAELNPTNQTIIINSTPAPQPNGININIGR